MVGGIGQAIGTALSGLTAQSKKLGVAASNIANAHTTGHLDKDELPHPYIALETVIVGSGDGSVRTSVVARDPGTVEAYDPDSPYADEDGMVGAPSVNIDEEMITTLQAAQAYKANAALIRTAKEMQEELREAINVKA
ncbi:MAG: hypothetical protein GC136_03010 [Alphaproteobacteria bacterium]|nr:hypothetical protein [Alphaproteobacteria bacterium]